MARRTVQTTPKPTMSGKRQSRGGPAKIDSTAKPAGGARMKALAIPAAKGGATKYPPTLGNKNTNRAVAGQP